MTDDPIQAEAERLRDYVYNFVTCDGELEAFDSDECVSEIATSLLRQRYEACPSSDQHHEHEIMWKALEKLGASFGMGLSDYGPTGIVLEGE